MGPGSFVSNICQGAASLAVAVKTKDKELKQIASSAGITALLGVTAVSYTHLHSDNLDHALCNGIG